MWTCSAFCPPLALLCDPNVTAKGRLRITGHFGSGLVMPYPCFLSKDNLAWLIAMPVIQSRCLILDRTFSLGQNLPGQRVWIFLIQVYCCIPQFWHSPVGIFKGLESHTFKWHWVLKAIRRLEKIWMIRQPSDNSGERLQAHSDLFFLLCSL